ncbi:thiamine pyrophosphate protein TPP binding domain protein [Solidesulfovibrio fructosivorans JJ]]|uniref:Thiamine pyrophosphate protein TPP binding domain protein n=1 Tax=Solidesulfovibrio fructosivorans JJ] TaxID=596151 RepID=E1JW38_SOLFR|nr:thiamine pyrophosphate-binding protein [Solidesulfovibrio fructosivorans]EFL51398.1 thiamine pyrophosphate protein TPP binding domain protein [Solidesulfovibrio fructosivorans JJ]]
MTATVVEHLMTRLKQIGVTDVFGVPGDFSFALNDAVDNDPDMRWIGCCNELNAAYAADGYARVKGRSALCTTYGVGELSALCGVAGSYTEHLPVIHLVGMPSVSTQKARRIVHHTLGTGNFEAYADMTKPVVAASAILTPENAACQIERCLEAAVARNRPVYMALPQDYADKELAGELVCAPEAPQSDPGTLAAAIDAIAEMIGAAQSAVVLAGYLIARLGLRQVAKGLLTRTGLPFATMFMDKTALDETLPGYIGLYDGRIMNPEVRDFVEGCDCVLNIGALWSDFNTGAFTAKIDPARMIAVMQHEVRVGHATFLDVEMRDVLEGLAKVLPAKPAKVKNPAGLGEPKGAPSDPICPDYLYPRFEKFLREGDIVMAETGTISMGLGFAKMPTGAEFFNQTLWGSIGWATPAAFGAAMAAPKRRTLLFTGEGSHQMTAQDIGQFGRYDLKPIIFCLNNDGYLIERLLCKDPKSSYNDLAPWNYTQLPAAFGMTDWYCAKASTNAELEAVMAKAETCGTGAYIEVVMDQMAASPLAKKLGESIQTLYSK